MVPIEKPIKTNGFLMIFTFEKLSGTSPEPLQNLSKMEVLKSWVCVYIYIYIYSILEQPGLTLEREARLIGEPICYDKELERSLAINAKIGKNIYFAFGLTSASHYLDIGLTFILTSASHSFWHRLRRIVLTSASQNSTDMALPGIADQPAS